MDFKQLQSFVSVVRSQNFTMAAEELGISQPTISTHIRLLEEELDSRLIVRTAKSFEVTPHGLEFYELAQQILKSKEDLMDRWHGKESRVIQLGVSTIPSAYILPEILPRFGEKYPDVYFSVRQSDSKAVIDAIHRGEYDIGLVGMKADDELLEFQEFYQDRMVAVTPVNEHFLKLKEQNILPIEQLLEEPMIIREEGSGSGKTASKYLKNINADESKLQIVAKINDQEAIKNLVAGGMGISIVSEKAVKDYVREHRLLQFDLPDETAGRTFYIVHQKNYILRDYVKAFIEYIVNYYQK